MIFHVKKKWVKKITFLRSCKNVTEVTATFSLLHLNLRRTDFEWNCARERRERKSAENESVWMKKEIIPQLSKFPLPRRRYNRIQYTTSLFVRCDVINLIEYYYTITTYNRSLWMSLQWVPLSLYMARSELQLQCSLPHHPYSQSINFVKSRTSFPRLLAVIEYSP